MRRGRTFILLALVLIVGAALLWFRRHPGEWRKLVDDFADFFPEEHHGEEEAPTPRKRSA